MTGYNSIVPHFFVLKDSRELAQRAFDGFIDSVGQTLAKKERFCLAISGGNTPKRFFELQSTKNFGSASF